MPLVVAEAFFRDAVCVDGGSGAEIGADLARVFLDGEGALRAALFVEFETGWDLGEGDAEGEDAG